eukprot:scaffold36407_cov28-Tisochrysis_lutea.AAC.2
MVSGTSRLAITTRLAADTSDAVIQLAGEQLSLSGRHKSSFLHNSGAMKAASNLHDHLDDDPARALGCARINWREVRLRSSKWLWKTKCARLLACTCCRLCRLRFREPKTNSSIVGEDANHRSGTPSKDESLVHSEEPGLSSDNHVATVRNLGSSRKSRGCVQYVSCRMSRMRS